MSEDKQIKEDILFFLKSFAAAGLLILVIESAQLMMDLNYYHSYASYKETLRLSGLFLLAFLFISALAAGFLAFVASLSSNNGGVRALLKSVTETLCVTAILMAWIPAIITVFTKNFPTTMRGFWLGHYGLIPLFVLLFAIAMRLVFKNAFSRVFSNLKSTLWRPFVAVSILSFVWVAATIIFATPYDEKKEQLADSKSGAPNVILITFDTLAASDMSLYGYHLNTTPTMEALGRESFVFDRMHSSSNFTMPSVTSILTGKQPWTHEVFTEGQDYIAKSEKGENLAALLDGHYTAAITSTNQAFPPFLGMGGEFDLARWSEHENSKVASTVSAIIRRTLKEDPSPILMPVLRHFLFIDTYQWDLVEIEGQTFDKAKRFIEGLDERPFFLWTHIYPPHLPYSPPLPFLGSFLPYIPERETNIRFFKGGDYEEAEQALNDKRRLRYDEHIAFIDYKLSTFTDFLRDSGLYDNSIIIITSDHGEMFEKGWVLHGSPYLWEKELHVPLIIHLPGQRTGRRIGALAGGVDIAPTILELLGKPAPEWMEGESLVPYMKGARAAGGRTKFSMAHREGVIFANPESGLDEEILIEAIAAYKGDYKLLYDITIGNIALFNIKADPNETRDLARERIDIAKDIWGDIKGAVNSRELPE